MATMSKLHISPLDYHHRAVQAQQLRRQVAMWDPIPLKGRRNYMLQVQKCKSFKSGEESEAGDDEKEMASRRVSKKGNRIKSERGVYKLLGSLKSTMSRLSNLHTDEEDLEDNLSSMALLVGRYIVTMMNTGVILLTGFQLSGGDGQMNDLIWYSWLGGIIIGTMIGSNMVLDEVSRAGPRNVVITGSTRGLGKALAREFLLSGDRVIVASRSLESVEKTIKELEDSLKECLETADDFSRRSLEYAEVVGVACDVSDPKDVKKLADFAVNEFGSIDLWINNAGTNKGFRPLLLFSDEDIQQIVSTNLVGSIICTGEAMRDQNKGSHIFNMDGAGSGGSSTPETVARTLVPRMRVVKGNGKDINYLTPPRILLALVTAWLSVTDAMESCTEDTWVSVFSLSVVCAFIILSSTLNS